VKAGRGDGGIAAWEESERGRGRARALSDRRAMLAQINNYKLSMNVL